MRNRKMLWIILGLVAAVVICGGVVIYLLMSRPVSGPEPEDPGIEEGLDEETPDDVIDDPGDGESEAQPDGETEADEPEDSGEADAPETPAAPAPGAGDAGTSAATSTPPASSSTGTPASSTVATSVGNLTIDRTGTNDGVATVRNLYIAATPATVKNKTVQGDIIVQASAGNGDIVLENISCTGNIFLSGGSGKVTLRGVTAQGVVADKSSGTQNIIYTGQTSIPNLWVKSHVTVDESGLSNGFGGVSDIISEAGGRIWNEVTLKSAQVDNITTATPTNIEVPTGSTVQKVTAGAQTHVSGRGTVRELTVSSDQVTYENKPVHVTESEGRLASQSSGAIGTDDYGVQGASASTGSSSSTRTSSSSSATRKLATPTEIEIYTKDDGAVYLDFKGDSKASEGHVVTVNVGGSSSSNRVATLDLTRSQTTGIKILDNAENDRNRTLRVSIYSKAVSNKYARSDTASAGNVTIRAAGGFDDGSLRIEPVSGSNSNNRYKFSWDAVTWEGQSSKVSKTDYTVEYRVNGGASTTRTVTGSTTYTMPNAVNLGTSGSIWVRVTATVDEDAHPVVVDRTRSIETTFTVGMLASPGDRSIDISGSAYAFTANWSAVSGASSYRVTPVINGVDGDPVSVGSGVTSRTFTLSNSEGAAATSVGFKIVAVGGSNIYQDSAEVSTTVNTTGSAFTLPAPTGLDFELLSSANRTLRVFWNPVENASNYDLIINFTHIDGSITSETKSGYGSTSYNTTYSASVQQVQFTVAAKAHANSWYLDTATPARSAVQVIGKQLDSPGSVTATLANDNKSIVASWQGVSDAKEYEVTARLYRSDGSFGSLPAKKVAQQSGDNSYTYTFNNVTLDDDDVRVTVTVQALPESGSSNTISALVESPPATVGRVRLGEPSNFAAIAVGNGFRITWDHGANFDSQYDQYVATLNGQGYIWPVNYYENLNAAVSAYDLTVQADKKPTSQYRDPSGTRNYRVVYLGNVVFDDTGFYLPHLSHALSADIDTISMAIQNSQGNTIASANNLAPDSAYDGSAAAAVHVTCGITNWQDQTGTVVMTIRTTDGETYTVIPFVKS